MSFWRDLYLTQAESIQVTQRWLDWELKQEVPDTVVCDALAGLLKADVSLLRAIERRIDEN